MEVESDANSYEIINLQTFYILCRTTIYNHPETYRNALDNIMVVTPWINTIDSMDVSLMTMDTLKIVDEIVSENEISRYIAILTEITIILNNIFYNAEKPYKKFWKENTNLLYNRLIYPIMVYDNTTEIKQCDPDMDVDHYYSRFFTLFHEKCMKSGLIIDLEEYVL